MNKTNKNTNGIKSSANSSPKRSIKDLDPKKAVKGGFGRQETTQVMA
jgi:hypothetical protein